MLEESILPLTNSCLPTLTFPLSPIPPITTIAPELTSTDDVFCCDIRTAPLVFDKVKLPLIDISVLIVCKLFIVLTLFVSTNALISIAGLHVKM